MIARLRDTVDVRRALLLVAALGCGAPTAKPTTTPPPPPPAAHADDDPTCPVLVAGTSVTVEDSDGGAALVFVTTGDVAAVRKRAAALAAMHNGGAHDMHAMGAMIDTASTAAATDVPNGARVAFTAADPKAAGALGDELRMHAHHLAGGTCEMHM
jgi:hypothetical protein